MVDVVTITQIGTTVLLGLAGAAIGFQKVVSSWKTTGVSTSILTLLHEEIVRTAKQNLEQKIALDQLQLGYNSLMIELGKLQLENQKLHAEIITLTNEVIGLQTALDRRKIQNET